MKASVIAASLVSLFALTPSMALAEPTELNIAVFCPATSAIANHGDYIAGYGQEVIEGLGGKKIYFKSTAQLSENTPKNFNQYRNENVEYDSTSGRVSCSYSGRYSYEPIVTVSYTLANGKGGIVTSQSQDSVFISLPLGLRA